MCVGSVCILGLSNWLKNYIQNFYQNIIKFKLYSNLKDKHSARKNKAFGFSPEATRGRIEQNLTNCTFLQSRAGQYEQKLISLYFCPDLRYTVHISVFCILIKQINKVNVTM